MRHKISYDKPTVLSIPFPFEVASILRSKGFNLKLVVCVCVCVCACVRVCVCICV